jgi:hypothetical protein
MIVAGLLAIPAAADEAPYRGWQGRQIKALSAGQIEDLRAGRGMGMALSAELNGYPGPRHVLDLASELDLSAAQRAEVQRLFDTMQAQAIVLGQQVIESEAALDQMFAEQAASDEVVQVAAVELGRLQGELRGHHLRYHLATRDLLSPHQVMRYQQLRGYQGEGASGHGAGHGHGVVR